jgi:uroporphyrinogen-III synthase
MKNNKGKEKPLIGKRIVVTRSHGKNRDFASQLMDMGAQVIQIPSISTEPIAPTPEISNLIREITTGQRKFDWVIFLSATAVKMLAGAMGKGKVKMAQMRICAVGPKTKEAILQEGWGVVKTAQVFSSKGVLKTLGDLRNQHVLIPRVQGGPREFIWGLQKKGAQVLELPLYKTVPAPPPSDALRHELKKGVDAITFTSSSTARNFCRFFSPAKLKTIFKKPISVSIGPSTTQTLKSFNIPRIIQSKSATTEEMVSLLIGRLKK